MAGGGGQSLECLEEVGPCILDFGTGGRIRQDIGNILQVSGSGGSPIRIIDVVRYPVHFHDAGGIRCHAGSHEKNRGGTLTGSKGTPLFLRRWWRKVCRIWITMLQASITQLHSTSLPY